MKKWPVQKKERKRCFSLTIIGGERGRKKAGEKEGQKQETAKKRRENVHPRGARGERGKKSKPGPPHVQEELSPRTGAARPGSYHFKGDSNGNLKITHEGEQNVGEGRVRTGGL